MDFKKVKKIITDFRDERNWKEFHNAKDLATAMAIEVAELQEHFLWIPSSQTTELAKHSKEVHDEIADVFIYLVQLCEICDLNFEKIVVDKMKKNTTKHTLEKLQQRNAKHQEYGEKDKNAST